METAQVNFQFFDVRLILANTDAMFKLLKKISLFCQRINSNWVIDFAQDLQLPLSILRFRSV
jgi:hypothetical protein